jgi:iron complex transport system substrate-binding protein
VDEIFAMLYQVAAMVGQPEAGLAQLQAWRAELDTIRQQAASFKRRPKVFFEEWDTPHISGIRWVSELMGIAGGDDIFPELAAMPLGKDRIIADGQTIVDRAPDIIIGSWCGKKFRPDTVAARSGWQDVPAVRTGQIFEIKSADILQPGPAALTDGVAQLHRIMTQWEAEHA